jgi:glycosyltransferase involved in cell wall biosynthesis
VHIATEGPIGFETRRRCERAGIPYTTSYHTQFPEYMKRYFALPMGVTWRFMQWFHGGARATLAPTEQVTRQLRDHGIARAQTWCRGVDTTLFRPSDAALFAHLPRPVHLYAGRVAREKNIDAFMQAQLPGSKVVVGDGPERARLERAHPDVYFAGYRFGEELAAHYASGDVYLHPSLTETFGNVVTEAMASGLPVCAFDDAAAHEFIRSGENGLTASLGDLESFMVNALTLANDRELRQRLGSAARVTAQQLDWGNVVSGFEKDLVEMSEAYHC